ncbi:MAG: hypothetical protein ABSD74_01680 [Rhizomicrobium sp.]|jgi:hypothetical protein
MTTARTKRPRCYLVYAGAPDGTAMRAANDAINAINALVGDEALPLCFFHDHFLDRPGGLAVFYVTSHADVDAIDEGIVRHLKDWNAEARPLIFSFNPAAFDEQIAYTLRTYRDKDWSELKTHTRPAYANPFREAEAGIED